MDPKFKNMFYEICVKFKNVLPGSSVWKLDDRFNTVVAAFEKGGSEIIFSTLKASFSQEWSKKTVRKAPENIKSIASSISGIEKGQIVFTTDDNEVPVLFAAWWPWGDGINVSLRIGVSDSSLNEEDIKNHLVEWFELKL
jgi:hypothetical protein